MQHEGADGQIEELSTKHLPNSMTISPSATTNTLRLGSYPKAKTETPTENNTQKHLSPVGQLMISVYSPDRERLFKTQKGTEPYRSRIHENFMQDTNNEINFSGEPIDDRGYRNGTNV